MGFNIGDTVGDYQIIGVLGAGGMGKVYKVRNVISDRIEAMKVLLPDLANEPELADRFIREIKLLASLEHSNIAALRTAMRVENQLVMIMEFVEGSSLDSRVQQGPLPAKQAVSYVIQMLSALSYAHERGIIHRDIKPANMMVTPDGTLKLMDFGIAKAAADRRLTMTGTTMGSLYYMSPEQVKGSASIDARADLYSVGVALYELVTGTRPFKGDSDYAIMVAHLEMAPVAPVEVDPKLPPMLNDIIMTAIRKEPEKRFQTAKAFAAALGSALKAIGGEMPVSAAPPPRPAAPAPAPAAPQAAPKPVAAQPAPQAAAAAAKPGGHRGLWMAMGAIIVLAVLGVAAFQLPKWFGTRAGSPPATPATEQVAAMPAAPAMQSPAGETSPAPAPVQTAPVQSPTQTAVQSQVSRGIARPAVKQAGAAAVQQPYARPQQPQPIAPAVQTPVQQPASQPAVQPQPQAAPPQNAASEALIEELRDRFGKLDSRASSVDNRLQGLERQQRARGQTLRSDMSLAWREMGRSLKSAEDALAKGDANGARRRMDEAEGHLGKLEKFFP